MAEKSTSGQENLPESAPKDCVMLEEIYILSDDESDSEKNSKILEKDDEVTFLEVKNKNVQDESRENSQISVSSVHNVKGTFEENISQNLIPNVEKSSESETMALTEKNVAILESIVHAQLTQPNETDARPNKNILKSPVLTHDERKLSSKIETVDSLLQKAMERENNSKRKLTFDDTVSIDVQFESGNSILSKEVNQNLNELPCLQSTSNPQKRTLYLNQSTVVEAHAEVSNHKSFEHENIGSLNDGNLNKSFKLPSHPNMSNDATSPEHNDNGLQPKYFFHNFQVLEQRTSIAPEISPRPMNFELSNRWNELSSLTNKFLTPPLTEDSNSPISPISPAIMPEWNNTDSNSLTFSKEHLRSILSHPSSNLTSFVDHSQRSSNFEMPITTACQNYDTSHTLPIFSPLPHFSSPSRKELLTSRQHLNGDTKNFIEENQRGFSKIWNSIGKKVILPNDALQIILSWSADWLLEKNSDIMPPICGRSDFPLQNMNVAKYNSLSNYLNKIFPLLLYDLFFRLREMLKQAWKQGQWYELEVLSVTKLDNEVWELDTKLPFPKGAPYPSTEQLALVKFISVTGEEKSMLAYISSRSLRGSKDPNNEELQFFRIILTAMQQTSNIDSRKKIKLLGFYVVSVFLNQIKAIISPTNLSLVDIILNPSQPQCSNIQLEKLGSVQMTWSIINDGAERINKQLALDYPDELRILVIQSPVGSDLISTLIAFVDGIKKREIVKGKRRVLFCVRSLKRLEEVCFRFQPSAGGDTACSGLKLLILGKVQHSELKELTLRNQVDAFVKQQNLSGSSEDQCAEAQKAVLENTDIIMTCFAHCYNESLIPILGNRNFVSFCIIDEAYTFTEPETFLPLVYGANKLILAGDPLAKPRTVAPIISAHDYYISLASRINLAIDDIVCIG